MIQKDRWSGWFHFTESRKCSWMGGSLDGAGGHWMGPGVTGWGRGSLDGVGGHWMGPGVTGWGVAAEHR